MRQILFVKYNRTRAEQFQLKTEIVREDGVLTVEKTALTKAGEAHIHSFGEKDPRSESGRPLFKTGVEKGSEDGFFPVLKR